MAEWSSVLDSQSSSPEFESHSGDLMDLFLVILCSNPRPHLVKSQLVASCQLGFKNPVFDSKYLSGVLAN